MKVFPVLHVELQPNEQLNVLQQTKYTFPVNHVSTLQLFKTREIQLKKNFWPNRWPYYLRNFPILHQNS